MGNLPAEDEPDGDRWLPHHGLYALVFMAAGWFLWAPEYSPELGAALFGLGVLLALDDWLSHAFGIWTPADAAFKRLMRWGPFRRAWRRLLSLYR